MVSFWPWSGDSNSPASFEKTLSTLSAKITDTQARLDRTRASSRRVRVLSTLYLSFAYVVYAIILLVVVGYPNLGAYEWTVLCGGPVLIYTVRTVFSTFYSFRIDSLATRLKDQTAEREKTIQKLKDATKYDSTLKLIEKYGGETPEKKKKDEAQKQAAAAAAAKQAQAQGSPHRTRMPPPATANIQRQAPQQQQQQPGSPQSQGPSSPHAEKQQQQDTQPTEEFAPNAYSASHPPPPPQHQQQQFYAPESHWYDRVFDVLLGEDEAAPKNRIVLLCQSCRLVNGQAPPGTKTLAEVGMWRCMACHVVNGEEDEGKRIIKQVLAQTDDKESPASEPEPEPEHVAVDQDEASDEGGVRRRKSDNGDGEE